MKTKQLLYIIEAGGIYKIGISSDIDKRIKAIQTASPHKVKCVAYYETELSARTIEIKLHKLFEKYRLEGEWFDFEGKFTQEAFDTLCDRYGMTKLEILEDGSFLTLYEKPKKRIIKNLDEKQITSKEKQVQTNEEWRKYYGIKSKR